MANVPTVNAIVLVARGVRVPSAPAWLLAMAEAERGRTMPWLAVFMAAGVLGFFTLAHEPPRYAGPVLLGACVALLLLLRAHATGRAVSVALLAAAAGFASAQLASARAPPLLTLPKKAAEVTATVSGIEQLPEGRRLTLTGAQLDGGPALPRFLHVRLRAADAGVLATGDTVRIRTVLRPPAPPAYPGAWDLQRDAYFSGLGGSGTALGPVDRVVQAQAERPGGLQRLRETVAARFVAGLPGPQGTVAAVLFTGLGTAIPAADRAAFRDSGLAHLLAVAGLHIGIVMGLVMGVTRFGLALWGWAALRWPCKQIAAGTALGAGAGYVLLTGMHVPVLRSFAMAALVTLGVAVGRRAISMRGLAMAAMALMAVAPQEVLGVSFQMSFAAVLALIAGYEALRPSLSAIRRRRVLHHAATLVLTSLLAGAASAPFGAYHFGRVQAYFILANLVAVPLTAVLVMPAGLLALLLMPLGLEQVALWPMGWGLDAILWVARTVAGLPAAVFAVPHMPGWGLGVTALGLAWLGLWRSRLRLAGAPVILAGLLSGLVSPPADLLVSPDARLIALRSPAGLQTRPGFSGFVLDSWQQYWAERLDTPFPENGPPGPVRCTPAGCRIEQGGGHRAARPRFRPGGLHHHHDRRFRRTAPRHMPVAAAHRPLHRVAGRRAGGLAAGRRGDGAVRPCLPRRPALGAALARRRPRPDELADGVDRRRLLKNALSKRRAPGYALSEPREARLMTFFRSRRLRSPGPAWPGRSRSVQGRCRPATSRPRRRRPPRHKPPHSRLPCRRRPPSPCRPRRASRSRTARCSPCSRRPRRARTRRRTWPPPKSCPCLQPRRCASPMPSRAAHRPAASRSRPMPPPIRAGAGAARCRIPACTRPAAPITMAASPAITAGSRNTEPATSVLSAMDVQTACTLLEAAGFDAGFGSTPRLEPREDRWLVTLPGDVAAWFPMNAAGVQRLASERRLLAVLACHCRFRVPRVLHAAEAGWQVRAVVPGVSDPWGLYVQLRKDRPRARSMGRALGAILAEQHSQVRREDVAWLPRRPPWPEPEERLWPALTQTIRDAAMLLPIERVLRRYWDICNDADDGVLVHGDLGLHNIAVDSATGDLAGVFDYDGASWADRHQDFRYLAFPGSDAGDLLDGALEAYEAALRLHLDRDRILLCNAACAIGFLAFRNGGRKPPPAAGPWPKTWPGSATPSIASARRSAVRLKPPCRLQHPPPWSRGKTEANTCCAPG